jgi:hypothetical protein
MKMIDAKKEIEDKLFQGAPLSLDALMCALVAINAYVEQHGPNSSIAMEIKIPDEEYNIVQDKATEMLMSELQKGFESGEKDGWLSIEDARGALDAGWGV